MSAALRASDAGAPAEATPIRSRSGSVPALELDGVAKRFARGATPPALEDVGFALEGGRVLLLIGENGAGKTTLLRTVAGLIAPDAGVVRVFGREQRGLASAASREIGWCSSDERSFYPRLTGAENLRLFGALRGLRPRESAARVAGLSGTFGLAAALAKPFQSCSTGERQRLNVARALLHEPSLLLLDEPARSLDLATREALVDALRAWVAGGERSAVVAGHDFEGFEGAWDEVLVMHRGRVVERARAPRAAGPSAGAGWEVVFRSSAARERALRESPFLRAGPGPESALCDAEGDALPPELIAFAARASADVERLERRRRGIRELLASVRALDAARPDGAGETAPTVSPAAGDAPAGARAATDRPVVAARAAGEPRGAAARPARPAVPVARVVAALARRDRLVYLSHRFQTALKLALLCVWILTLSAVATLVDEETARAYGVGGDWFTYALLGLAGLRLGQVCLVQMAGALREEQLQGTVEPLFATGARPIALVAGGLAWPLLSDVLGLAVVFAASSWLLGADLARADLPALAVALLATLVATALLGVVSSACVLAFKRGDPVTLLFNVVSIGLSGVFFPVELVPAWLQPLGRVLPLSWGLEAARAGRAPEASAFQPSRAAAGACARGARVRRWHSSSSVRTR